MKCQVAGLNPQMELQSMSKSVTLSLALESGVLLAMHCHELLSVWLTYLTAETRETTKELNGISLGVGCPKK